MKKLLAILSLCVSLGAQFQVPSIPTNITHLGSVVRSQPATNGVLVPQAQLIGVFCHPGDSITGNLGQAIKKGKDMWLFTGGLSTNPSINMLPNGVVRKETVVFALQPVNNNTGLVPFGATGFNQLYNTPVNFVWGSNDSLPSTWLPPLWAQDAGAAAIQPINVWDAFFLKLTVPNDPVLSGQILGAQGFRVEIYPSTGLFSIFASDEVMFEIE